MVYIINNNRNNKEIKSVGALSQYLSPNLTPKIEIRGELLQNCQKTIQFSTFYTITNQV